jgi:hypothetical protein
MRRFNLIGVSVAFVAIIGESIGMVAFFQIRCSCPGPVRTDNEFLKSLKIRPPLPDLEFLGCEKRLQQFSGRSSGDRTPL